jgi:hypothetical protein
MRFQVRAKKLIEPQSSGKSSPYDREAILYIFPLLIVLLSLELQWVFGLSLELTAKSSAK